MKEQDEKAPSSNEIKNLSRIKIIFPIVMTIVVSLIVPSSTPLIGFLMFGNLIKEIGSSTGRLSKAASDNILNTISSASATQFVSRVNNYCIPP